MEMKSIYDVLSEHPFFREFPEEYRRVIAGCGTNAVFQAGQAIAKEGEPADHFYLVRSGKIAIQTFVPEQGAMTLQTLREGDVLGWSWLFPPYQWTFDAVAMDVTRAIAMNGKCLREKAEHDHSLGYHLMKRFAQIMTERLRATRLQLLDIYGREPCP